MKKKARIRKNEEFQTIIGAKKYVTSPSFSLYTKKKSEDISRFGITVGKKLGNAVARNKVKRQCRMMLSELNSTEYNFDGILMVRVDYHKFSYDENKKHLEYMLKKVKI